MEEAFALVDYDNLDFRKPQQGATESLVADGLTEIVSAVTRQAVDVIPLLDRIAIRLYGGWSGESGMPTRLAGMLAAHIPTIPRRYKRTVVIPTLVLGLFESSSNLRGTYRVRSRGACGRCGAFRSSSFGEQKMVDLLLGLDIHQMAERTDSAILVFSNDQDLVPAFLAAASRAGGRLFWVRELDAGAGPNDASLQDKGVSIIEIPERT